MRRKRMVITGVVMLVVVGFAVGLAVALRDSGTLSPRSGQPLKSKPLYVAMGDSIAAGPGLTGEADTDGCRRSPEAYPVQTAKRLDMRLSNLTCSGATIANGVNGPQQLGRGADEAQLARLYAGAKPDLISLTIGANDIDWSSLVVRCYIGNCGSAEDTAQVRARLDAYDGSLRSMLDDINRQYDGKPPKLVLTGYYRLISGSSESCPDIARFDDQEIAWWDEQQTALNDTIKRAADSYGYVRYAPVDFTGHEVCTSDPWVQGIDAPAPAHPTAAGHEAIMKAVVSAVR